MIESGSEMPRPEFLCVYFGSGDQVDRALRFTSISPLMIAGRGGGGVRWYVVLVVPEWAVAADAEPSSVVVGWAADLAQAGATGVYLAGDGREDDVLFESDHPGSVARR